MTALRWSSVGLLSCALALWPEAGLAEMDYDPASDEWNGLSRLLELAEESGVELAPTDVLDWRGLGPEQGVAVVYPRTAPSLEGLVAHLRRGGRALVADDFGESSRALRPLGVRWNEEPVRRGLHFRNSEHLPVARPVDEEHVLALGVRRLVGNHPSTLVTDLPPVFVTGDPPRSLVAVGAIGPGRLVLVGDPSVLINNMLELRGNERFARNLLAYLSRDGAGPVALVTGRFAQQSESSLPAGASAAREGMNAALARLSARIGPGALGGESPLWLLLVSALLATIGTAAVVLRVGPRPRLYGGQWLRPPTRQRPAGFVGTVEFLGGAGATHLYPMMILKREFEQRLLAGLELSAPARLDAVLKEYEKRRRVPADLRALKQLLVRFSAVSAAAAGAGGRESISAAELGRTMDTAQRLLKPLGQEIAEP